MQKPLWFVSQALGRRQLSSICTNFFFFFFFWRKWEKDLTPPEQAVKRGACGDVSLAEPFWWAGIVSVKAAGLRPFPQGLSWFWQDRAISIGLS